jgi:hypothetical protein
MKENNWDKLEIKENINIYSDYQKNEDPEDDLIDDLFDSLNLNN